MYSIITLKIRRETVELLANQIELMFANDISDNFVEVLNALSNIFYNTLLALENKNFVDLNLYVPCYRKEDDMQMMRLNNVKELRRPCFREIKVDNNGEFKFMLSGTKDRLETFVTEIFYYIPKDVREYMDNCKKLEMNIDMNDFDIIDALSSSQRLNYWQAAYYELKYRARKNILYTW